MKQPEGFIQEGRKSLVCNLNKSIYKLKQASRQWYLKFDVVVSSHEFEESPSDECAYIKMSEGHFIFLILYVDDILLACNNASPLNTLSIFCHNILK